MSRWPWDSKGWVQLAALALPMCSVSSVIGSLQHWCLWQKPTGFQMFQSHHCPGSPGTCPLSQGPKRPWGLLLIRPSPSPFQAMEVGPGNLG